MPRLVSKDNTKRALVLGDQSVWELGLYDWIGTVTWLSGDEIEIGALQDELTNLSKKRESFRARRIS